MNPSELTMLISSLAVLISNEVTDDNEFALWALLITRLGNTLTSISAQRILMNKIKSKQSNDASTATDKPNNISATSYKAPSGNPQ